MLSQQTAGVPEPPDTMAASALTDLDSTEQLSKLMELDNAP